MDEEAFLRTIAEEPASAAATWLVLADWLEERGHPRAELVRLCHDPQCYSELSPEQRDDRIRALLTAGVQPCVPTFTNSIGMKFALIPAGTFLMGSPESEEGRGTNEGPQHTVEISCPFFLGIHPVTQEQYEKVMHINPSHFTPQNGGAANHPVEQVPWRQAAEFCRRLSARRAEKALRRKYRLPTEAEWECACRGGASFSTPFSFGESLSSTQANFAGIHPYGRAAIGPYLKRTTPVGFYNPNAFGLYDMHGNVLEWCRDWYDANYYSTSPRQGPTGRRTGRYRVLRGGSWYLNGVNCRSADRHREDPIIGWSYHGFRVVCVAPGTS